MYVYPMNTTGRGGGGGWGWGGGEASEAAGKSRGYGNTLGLLVPSYSSNRPACKTATQTTSKGKPEMKHLYL